jgi:hypothetical protein
MRLSLQMFTNILSEQFPKGAFVADVHNLVWDSAPSEGVSCQFFAAVMSRAPLLLPYQSCHTMQCILSLCKTNSISCNELFFQLNSSQDGTCHRSEYAQTNAFTFVQNYFLHLYIRGLVMPSVRANLDFANTSGVCFRYVERCSDLLSKHCSANDVLALWSGLFGHSCQSVGARVAYIKSFGFCC